MPPRLVPVLAWAVDLVLLVAFVLIGRASHDAGLTGFVTTLLPFLAGLQSGWLLRAGQPPLALLRSGAVVWLTTLVVGMLLRAATGVGTAPAFVIVTALVLAAFFLGWRALALLALRLARRITPGD
jgi:Protein of unknown function (DUF3054)